MTHDEVIARLRAMGSEHNRQGMGRYGINVENALGISVFHLRKFAKEIGPDHGLALRLWDSGIHEARILASFIAVPEELTEEQMEHWVGDIDSWDLCDQVCVLFRRTPYAREKILQWTARDEEFVRRAGFVMIAGLATHEKQAPDDWFERYLSLIREHSTDNRNFVRKGVNWALRNIGKRNLRLNEQSIALSAELKESGDKAARWIGSNAHRELTSNKVQDRLNK